MELGKELGKSQFAAAVIFVVTVVVVLVVRQVRGQGAERLRVRSPG
ncbi:MAG: hypothetical protein K9N23_13580 [Akkermansiaceae bacterium]|nr:hypothetical protein [Akkermansiaceae bacterium]